MFFLDESITFPPVTMADEDGLLAIGGDLRTERLIEAYRKGIFPWYNEEEPILWWCPDPRFVLFPGELKISKSMKPLLNNSTFRFTVNKAFDQVMENCKTIERPGQEGTWISKEMQYAYAKLHREGYALSAEAWQEGKLAGGLYGIKIGNVFYGESMFSRVSNASKFAFIRLVETLVSEGVQLIDCQVYSEHLESLGARMIPRTEFISMLGKLTR